MTTKSNETRCSSRSIHPASSSTRSSSNFSTLQLLDPIKRVNGVGDVTIFGAGDYGMPSGWTDRIVGLSLSIDQVLQAVREQNVEVAAGQIGSPGPRGTFQYSVNTGSIGDAEEFGDIVIKIGEEGRMVRLHDVARIEQGSTATACRRPTEGEPCAVIAVYQLPGANDQWPTAWSPPSMNWRVPRGHGLRGQLTRPTSSGLRSPKSW